MEMLMSNLTLFVAVIGVLAFLVSVITEVFKNVGILKVIPTDIFVLILSVIMTMLAYVAFMQYIGQAILWYMLVAALLAGFIVAFIAMFGWEKITELWKRFYRE